MTVEVIIATAWDCPFDGPTPPQRVLDIVEFLSLIGLVPVAAAALDLYAVVRSWGG